MLDKFAEELKETREKKGITLQQMAARTRIDIKFLEAIDDGNFSFLPELYVKAFIKEYAKTLGLDEHETVKRFEEAREGRLSEEKVTESAEKEKQEEEHIPLKQKEEKPTVQTKVVHSGKLVRTFTDPSTLRPADRKEDKRKTIITIIGSVAGGAILTVIIFLLFFSNRSNIIVEEKPYDEILEQTNEERFTVKENEEEIQQVATSTDSLILQITNTDLADSAWVLVIYDDVKTEDFILIPKRSKTVRAVNNFKFTLGNSGVISLHLNNETLQFEGRKGSVRHFKLDRNGIERLFSPPTLVIE
jgi:transcriptional regulator with XRE-family HTH domain